MWTNWSAIAHRRFYRDLDDKPCVTEGWTVRRKKGSILRAEILQFVMCPKDLDTSDSMELAHLFTSKDAANELSDKMNAFEKMKKQWINKGAI